MSGFIQSGRFGGAAAFDPTTLVSGVSLWLDPTDISQFTFSSGVLVSQWADKSGRAQHVLAGSTREPSRSGTLNGLTTVVFTQTGGAEDAMATTTAAAWSHATDGAWTTWAVWVPSSLSGVCLIVDTDWQTGGNRLAQNIRTNGTTPESLAFADPIAAYTDTASALSTSTAYILCAVRRAATITLYVNGASNGSTATSGTNAKMTTRLSIGSRDAATGSFAGGAFGDVIHVNDDQSVADMNTLGSALASRWGLTWTTIT